MGGGVRERMRSTTRSCRAPEGIELFHGYTYSGHPLACAAGIATLDVYEEEGLLTRAASIEKHWEDGAHALKGAPHVVDVRNCGLMAAIELEPRAGQPGKRAYEVFVKAFEAGVLIRVTGDTIALSPPLIVEKLRSTGFSIAWERCCAR